MSSDWGFGGAGSPKTRTVRRRSSGLFSDGLLGLVACAPFFWASVAAAQPPDPDPWLGRDKTLHFVASSSIAAGTYVIGAANFEARCTALLFAGGVALTIGAGKEALDLTGTGTPSWRDFAWDAMGTVAGLGVAWALDLLLRGVDEQHPLLFAPKALVTF